MSREHQKTFLLMSVYALIAVVLLASCGQSDENPSDFQDTNTTGDTIPDTGSPAVVSACSEPTELFSVQTILADKEHPCFEWVEVTYGRTAMSGSMSATVWSLATPAGTGLLSGANHTLGEGWYGTPGSTVDAELFDPDSEIGIPRIYLTSEGGNIANLATPMFQFFHPSIPAAQTTDHLTKILPRHDFYVAVVDDQLLVTTPAETPSSIAGTPHIYDPNGVATSGQTWSTVESGDLVLAMGYPQIGNTAGQLSASVLRVQSDDEAQVTIDKLAKLGDEEGAISYDPEAEFIATGKAVVGMSGGAAFDSKGRLVGILVRATDAEGELPIVRVVRMSFVVNTLWATYDALSTTEQTAVDPYLEPR